MKKYSSRNPECSHCHVIFLEILKSMKKVPSQVKEHLNNFSIHSSHSN